MVNEKRLIDANEAYEIARLHHKDFAQSMADLTSLREVLEDATTVDAVEVNCIEEVKQVLLRIFDNLIAIHRDISNSSLANSAKYLDIPESSNDYYGIYADAMEVAREYVNIALTDLCDKDGRRE